MKYYEELYINKLDYTSSNLEERDKFQEMYNLPKLNQEQIENLNRPSITNEIEAILKKLPINKSPRRDGFTGHR